MKNEQNRTANNDKQSAVEHAAFWDVKPSPTDGHTCSLIDAPNMTCGDRDADVDDSEAAACSATNIVRLNARVKVDDLTIGTIAIFRAA